jgi:hypothetical protein
MTQAPIARHRRAMFCDMGYQDEARLDAMMQEFLPWIKAKIASAGYLAWLAIGTGDIRGWRQSLADGLAGPHDGL